MPLSSMAMRKVGDRYEHIGQADFSHLRYLMVCGCGFPNSKHNFEPAVAQFKQCFPANHTIITIPESPMFNVPQADIVTKPALPSSAKPENNTPKPPGSMPHCLPKSALP